MGMTTVLVTALTLGKSTTADENKVYIPDRALRQDVVRQIEEPVENELPTTRQIEQVVSVYGGNNGSLEGVQYATNAESINTSGGYGIIDFRPISGMKNLKEYYSYSSIIQGDPLKVLDISPFGKLINLEKLSFGYANIQDFSMLSDLPNLKSVTAFGGYPVKLPTVYVDKATKKFIMEHPVKYSKQFDGEKVVSGVSGAVLKGNAVEIENLEEDVSAINLLFEASSNDEGERFSNSYSNFYATFSCEIPIVWY